MSSDDLLEAATSALREETENAEAGPNFTRARVMASLHKTRERRRTRFVLLLPIAATFAAATAFGTAGTRLPALAQSVAVALGLREAPVAPPPVKAKPRSRPPLSAAPGAAPIVAAPVVDVPVAPVEAPPAVVTVPAANGAVRSAPLERSRGPLNAAPSSSANEPAHGLYLDAHRAHFERADYAAALPAWEAYLKQAPNGRFALEARYNRAVCLVRQGRLAEAREALQPFASGKLGGYRQHEAAALLTSLGE